MCCLGFAARQLFGYRVKDIKGLFDLKDPDLSDPLKNLPLFDILFDLNDDFVWINDDPDISEQEREKLLKKKFANIDIEVEFTE